MSNKIIQIINSYDNIYDVFIELYQYLKVNEADIVNYIDSNGDTWSECTQKANEILKHKDFCATMGRSQKDEVLNYIEKYGEIASAISLYQEIDVVFGDNHYLHSKEPNDESEKTYDIKALNSERTFFLGQVFKKNKSFLSNFFSSEMIPRQADKIGSSVEAYAKNLLICKFEETDYKIKMVGVSWQYIHQMIKKTKDKLNIALIPFTGDTEYIKFRPNVEGEKNFFVDGLENEDKYIKKLINIMDRLAENNVHIAVFPELTFSEKMTTELRKYLKGKKNKFLFVVTGSIWSNKSNICHFISGDGHLISSQPKLNKFHLKDDFELDGNNEGIDIKSENRIINVLDINEFGRIGTPICADFITFSYFKKMLNVGTNLCFIPAYTSSVFYFKTCSQMMGSINQGCVFVSNSCIQSVQKIEKLEESKKKGNGFDGFDVSIGYLPVKGLDEPRFKSCCSTRNKCTWKSKKFCFYITEISKNYCVAERIDI